MPAAQHLCVGGLCVRAVCPDAWSAPFCVCSSAESVQNNPGHVLLSLRFCDFVLTFSCLLSFSCKDQFHPCQNHCFSWSRKHRNFAHSISNCHGLHVAPQM